MPDDPPRWGWDAWARGAIAGIVALLASVLLVTGPSGRPTGPPPPAAVAADLNTAPRAVLLALPGLGPSRVDALIASRAEAPFATLEDVDRRVKGIGPATVEGLRPFVRVAEPEATGPTSPTSP